MPLLPYHSLPLGVRYCVNVFGGGRGRSVEGALGIPYFNDRVALIFLEVKKECMIPPRMFPSKGLQRELMRYLLGH